MGERIEPEKIRAAMLEASRGLSSGVGDLRDRMTAAVEAQRAMRNLADALSKNLGVREMMSVFRYVAAVESEKRQARLFLREIVRKAEADLGLKSQYDPRNRKKEQ